jgi:hypothetical protein
MAQDTEHEQALQERADALVAEQQLLQKRLLQLQQELESEADAVLQLAAEVAGKQAEHSRTVSHLDQLHDAYQQCLGLRLISGEGEQQQVWKAMAGWHLECCSTLLHCTRNSSR